MDIKRTQIRRTIARLFDSQSDAARKLDFSDRAVRFWIAKGPPPHVERVLERLREKEISLRQARLILRNHRERRIPAKNVKRRKITN